MYLDELRRDLVVGLALAFVDLEVLLVVTRLLDALELSVIAVACGYICCAYCGLSLLVLSTTLALFLFNELLATGDS